MKQKIYALIDCNSFYTSCEKIFRPDLNHKPVVVLSNNDGCIVALSEEAKKAGIRRGKPLFQVQDIVDEHKINVFSSNYALYGDISARIMKTLYDFSPDVEIYSIDEAFIDLTDISIDNLTDYAFKIKNTIEKWIGVPVSIGIGKTKTLAKLANKICKKYKAYKGVFDMTAHNDLEKILSSFHVSDIWGIGRQISILLEKNNILTPFDLIKCNDFWIKKFLTIKGYFTVQELRGIPCIQFVDEEPDKKTIISSRSFGQPISTKKELKESIAFHVSSAAFKLRQQNSLCSYVIVHIATNRFKETDLQYSNSVTIKIDDTNYTADLINTAMDGLDSIYKPGYFYKRAGIVLGGITPRKYKNKDLFTEDDFDKKERLNTAIDYLNSLYGKGSIKSAGYGFTRTWLMKQDFKSPDYTTSWDDLPGVK